VPPTAASGSEDDGLALDEIELGLLGEAGVLDEPADVEAGVPGHLWVAPAELIVADADQYGTSAIDSLAPRRWGDVGSGVSRRRREIAWDATWSPR
jgi:hypothetical protein